MQKKQERAYETSSRQIIRYLSTPHLMHLSVYSFPSVGYYSDRLRNKQKSVPASIRREDRQIPKIERAILSNIKRLEVLAKEAIIINPAKARKFEGLCDTQRHLLEGYTHLVEIYDRIGGNDMGGF